MEPITQETIDRPLNAPTNSMVMSAAMLGGEQVRPLGGCKPYFWTSLGLTSVDHHLAQAGR
jgi:hypothetical protein